MFAQNAYISKLWIFYNVTFNPEIVKNELLLPLTSLSWKRDTVNLRHLNSYYTDSIVYAFSLQSHITSATESTRCLFNQTTVKVKVNQSHYRSEVPRGFQEVKVPRLRDNGPEWW